MNADVTPAFLSLSELVKFLEYGLIGLIAIIVIIPAFLIFTLIFRQKVKAETVHLFKVFLTFVGGLVVLLFGFTYFADNTVVTKVSAEIDVTQTRIEDLTKTIEAMEVSGAEAGTRQRLEAARAALNTKLNELKRITGDGADFVLLKDERPYKGMPTGDRIVEIAKSRLGTKWVYGKRAQLTNPDYEGPWDNSEFMGWVVYQATGEVIGCEPPDAGLADCYTGFWGNEPGEAGLEKTVDWGVAYAGAILVRLPNPGVERAGKVGVSLGDGRFVESNGEIEKVMISDAQPNDFWDFAIQLY